MARRWPSALSTLLAAALAACATAPSPRPPPLQAPASFHEATAAVAGTVPAPADGRWWLVFGGAGLDELVRRADAGHVPLALALTRVAQARAALAGADAQSRPQATLGASASRRGGPLLNAAGTSGTLLEAGISLSVDLDLAGRAGLLSQAARADLHQREALAIAARLQMQAQVVQTWLTLRGLAAEGALLGDAAASWQRTHGLLDRRQRAGLDTQAPALRADAEAAALAAEASVVERRRADAHHALALLLGATAGDVALDDPGPDVATAFTDAEPPAVPPGLPSRLLQRRPDIAAARQAVLAAQRRLGLAQTAWWPGLTLTASGGQASSDLAGLLAGGARSWGLAGLLAVPLFDGGRRDAARALAESELSTAELALREQVLQALREVDDQLATLRWLADEATQRRRAVDAAERAAAQADGLVRRGLASALGALVAHRQALHERRALLQVQAARWQASVALVRALGGRWDDADSPDDAGPVAPQRTAVR